MQEQRHSSQLSPLTKLDEEDPSSRVRGLAPWHRANSDETMMSASSSVHKLLMGDTPLATPIPQSRHSPEHTYEDFKGKSYEKGIKTGN